MTKFVSDCTNIMRLVLGRRNENDPDASDDVMRGYLNDFINLTMSDDLRIFEQFGTLTFNIDETNTTGVYTFNDVEATNDFTTISKEAFITLTAPVGSSVSWNKLYVFSDPGIFYQTWGINNEDILIAGYPTEMLYYGTQMVFRTIPNTTYTVMIYGYKIASTFSSAGNPALPFDYWIRYLAYGAALNYARDYRYDGDRRQQMQGDFQHEKKLLLSRVHNQIKTSRAKPRF
jgi:hypothetical protein